MKTVLALTICLAAFVQPLLLGKKNPELPNGAPLPTQILTAKTVFLSVDTVKRDFHYKNAYKYLADWDRWKIVDDPKQADIIIHITDGSAGSVGFGSGSATSLGGYTQASSTVLGIPLRHYYMQVLDGQKGTVLWSTDTDERLARSHDTKRMLGHLKQRIAEIEHQHQLK